MIKMILQQFKFQYAPVDGIDDDDYDYEEPFDESEFRKQNWQHFRLNRQGVVAQKKYNLT